MITTLSLDKQNTLSMYQKIRALFSMLIQVFTIGQANQMLFLMNPTNPHRLKALFLMKALLTPGVLIAVVL